jgi:hypothetical protein
MHPWASGWHHHHHRGGRRVVWFALGAVAATWYHHAKERRDVQGGWGCTWRHRRELEALRAAGTGEPAPAELEYSREWRLQYPPPSLRSQQLASPARAAPPSPPPAEMPPMPERLPGDWETVRRERWSPPSSQPAPEWEEEKERVREFTKQAEEKVRVPPSSHRPLEG